MIEVKKFTILFCRKSQITISLNTFLEIAHCVLFLQNDSTVLLEISLKDQFLKKRDGNWIGLLSIILKQYKNHVHNSTEITPKQASLKKLKDMFTRVH